MAKNAIRDLWQQGKTVINGWSVIPSSWSAEILANAGYDSVTLDLQHGMIHYDSAVPMLQAISTTSAVPMARVPWNEPGIIMKMLDAGCLGIICPMVNTRQECEKFVGACRYFNDGGYRSYGPVRANVYVGSDYFQRASQEVLTFAMIETAQAVENIASILSVPGLDEVYVGPADLSITYDGRPTSDYEGRADLLAKLDIIVAACRRHKIAAGIHAASLAHAQRMEMRGFNFITMLSDGAYLSAAVKRDVTAMRNRAEDSAVDSRSPY